MRIFLAPIPVVLLRAALVGAAIYLTWVTVKYGKRGFSLNHFYVFAVSTSFVVLFAISFLRSPAVFKILVAVIIRVPLAFLLLVDIEIYKLRSYEWWILVIQMLVPAAAANFFAKHASVREYYKAGEWGTVP